MKDPIALPGEPAKSPSGKYSLSISETKTDKGIYWDFNVSDNEGGIFFTANEKFFTRHATIIMWDHEDRVWVYSGDIGVFIWEYDTHTKKWTRNEFTTIQFDPPDPIKKRIFRNK